MAGESVRSIGASMVAACLSASAVTFTSLVQIDKAITFENAVLTNIDQRTIYEDISSKFCSMGLVGSQFRSLYEVRARFAADG